MSNTGVRIERIGTVEQIVAVPIPRNREEAGVVIQLNLQGRFSDRVTEQIIEQTVEAPVPQIREHGVEAMKVIL